MLAAWVVLQCKQSVFQSIFFKKSQFTVISDKKDNSQSTVSAKKSVKQTVCRQPRKTFALTRNIIQIVAIKSHTFFLINTSSIFFTFVTVHAVIRSLLTIEWELIDSYPAHLCRWAISLVNKQHKFRWAKPYQWNKQNEASLWYGGVCCTLLLFLSIMFLLIMFPTLDMGLTVP